MDPQSRQQPLDNIEPSADQTSESDAIGTQNEFSPSPPSSSEAPMILYTPPTPWSLLRGAAINLLLPFVNGLMLGFGELLAHEVAFRFGWSGTKIFPSHRSSRPAGPGVEVVSDPGRRRRRDGSGMEDLTSLE